MRPDMDELLVERPRWGSRIKNPDVRADRVRQRDVARRDAWDELPGHAPSRPRRARRELSENLNPLIRFLRSRCGRRWDAVYAELRGGLDPRSAVQLHLFQHLWQFVSRHVELRPDGVWRRPEGYRDGYLLRGDGQHFYVHPRSGRLHLVPHRRPRPRPPSPDHHRGPDGACYARRDGIWWRVELARVPWLASTPRPVDVLLGGPVSVADEALRAALYGAPGLYATARAPLNRRALRALGLWRR